MAYAETRSSLAVLLATKDGRLHEMTTASESTAEPDDANAPADIPTPKRGAFPTPPSEIEKARPYVPEAGEVDGCPEMRPDPPTDADGEERS